jgi:N,N-dimethylformamidase
MAYADRQSVSPGETVAFKVSCEGAPTVRADAGRLRAPNVGPGPDVPAFDFQVLESPLNGDRPAVFQPIDRGSYVRIDPGDLLGGVSRFTLCATIHPTLRLPSPQTIFGTASAGAGLRLVLVDDELALEHGGSLLLSGVRIVHDRWSFVSVTCEDRTVRFDLFALPSNRHEPSGWVASTVTADHDLHLGDGPLVVGADLHVDARGTEVPRSCYNGKIERPRLFPRPLGRDEVEAVAALGPARAADGALGDWDFSSNIGGETVADDSGNELEGVVHSLPTRAVGGSNWSGVTDDWTARPEEYGAIHFHDDDLLDAEWDTTHELVVPDDWPSGVYAARFTAGAAVFWVPFVVRARTPRSDVVFLLPTATYGAYANLRMRVLAQVVELMQGRVTVLDDTDLLLLDQPLGLSTYDSHSDGSNVVHATMRQPVTNFRPEGRIYKFCQDMLIVAWLEHEGLDYDVITDEDVDREGVSALAGYRVVLTGSHPEYVTTKMLDAVDAHVRAGARLMYIGGNGFYARIAYHPDLPGLVEVRRPDNPKLWAADAAQGHLAFTGEMAGLWSGVGRSPHLLTGVGFITQGFDESAGYRRTSASNDERAAFIFEGIDDDVVGDFGLLMNGAAGYEIDRADPGAGTPSHALVLASSEGHSNIFDLALTSIADKLPVGHDEPDRIRADIVFFETAGGGAVFSVGSIAWSGSLAHNGYVNNVARLTRNVLTRFADPTPFVLPTGDSS